MTEEGAYHEKGSAFRPSFRIGMMMSELQSLNVLRGERVDGAFPIGKSLELCVEIAEMARTMEISRGNGPYSEYNHAQCDIAFRRKPLAIAHSTIGSNLTTLENQISREQFARIVAQHGLGNEAIDPFAIIAEHYRIAAEAELPDAENGSIYWWAYAANMARAGNVRGDGDLSRGGYTLGELRSAIAKAEEAERARDVSLFGVNQQRGATFETIAKLTASHYRMELDSFILPEVKIVNEGFDRSLRVGDEIICSNYSAYERKEMAFYASRKTTPTEMMDTSKIEKEYGAAPFHGVPPLETLCIRELHKQDCEFAVGETDAAVIHCKAMMAAAQAGS